jgi:hypothetical protein
MESGLEVHNEEDGQKEAYSHTAREEGNKEAYSNPDVFTGYGALHTGTPSDSARQSGTAQRQRICGLSTVWFGVLVALVTAAIVGAAVGGGVGSQLGKRSW